MGNVNGQDVQCTVASSKYIGDVRCIVWRTTTTDGWDFDKLVLKTGDEELILDGDFVLDNDETKEFCFPVEYTITVSIKAGSIHYGTAADQFVKIKGSEGLTEELHCDADFDVNGQDVQCTVASSKYIGDVRCIVWRT